MYYVTVNNLVNYGLVKQGDIVVACMDSTASGAFFGGAIGAAIASSNASRYIMAVNEKGVSLFDVDKKTGNYLGTCSEFKKEEILKASVGGLFGSFNIILKTASGSYKFQTKNKFYGYLQKEPVARLKAAFKSGLR